MIVPDCGRQKMKKMVMFGTCQISSNIELKMKKSMIAPDCARMNIIYLLKCTVEVTVDLPYARRSKTHPYVDILGGLVFDATLK
jgi:hypothetical protein